MHLQDIWEEEAGMRKQGGSWEEEAGMSQLGAGRHLGGMWELPGGYWKQLGSIWEATGRHLGAPWRFMEAPGGNPGAAMLQEASKRKR